MVDVWSISGRILGILGNSWFCDFSIFGWDPLVGNSGPARPSVPFDGRPIDYGGLSGPSAQRILRFWTEIVKLLRFLLRT